MHNEVSMAWEGGEQSLVVQGVVHGLLFYGRHGPHLRHNEMCFQLLQQDNVDKVAHSYRSCWVCST